MAFPEGGIDGRYKNYTGLLIIDHSRVCVGVAEYLNIDPNVVRLL